MYSTWEELENACRSCTKCGLCEGRTNVVVGMGNPQAKVMFVGEGPGEQETCRGNRSWGAAGNCSTKCSTRSTSTETGTSISGTL